LFEFDVFKLEVSMASYFSAMLSRGQQTF